MRINKLPTGRYQVRWRDKAGVQKARNFRTKEMACDFRQKLELGEEDEPNGMTIGDLVKEYKASPTWANLDYPTQITYERTIARWFDLIEDVTIRELDPSRVSVWLGDMKANADRFGKLKQRQSFLKELNVLRSIIAWYKEYKDDSNTYQSPIRSRHDEECWLDGKGTTSSDEDFEGQVADEIPLTEAEFLRFRAEIRAAKFGDILGILADVQFDHSLRISEAAALMWPDVRWQAQEIKFQRHIQWVHQGRGKFPDKVAPGLKNKKAVKRKGQRFARRQALSKTNPFFPRSTAGLRELYLKAKDKTGYVFPNPETGSFLTYKCIKDKYDRAFKRAGLPYTGTHIVRYGGVNHFIGEYDADAKTAMELLGNESEGRYILRKPTGVLKALKRKEPSASNVHSAQSLSRNCHETRDLERNGGTDGNRSVPSKIAIKTAQ